MYVCMYMYIRMCMYDGTYKYKVCYPAFAMVERRKQRSVVGKIHLDSVASRNAVWWREFFIRMNLNEIPVQLKQRLASPLSHRLECFLYVLHLFGSSFFIHTHSTYDIHIYVRMYISAYLCT